MVEARGATLEDVLKALQDSFKFRYRSSETLGDGLISGTYSGPLPRVIGRLLDGHNYTIRETANHLDVAIFGVSGPDRARAPQASSPQPPKDCKYDDGVRVIPVEC